jgi:Ca-activated chloride channel homolog
MNFDEFHFLRPLCLSLLVPWALLLWRLWQQKIGTSFWQQVCDPELIPHIVTVAASQQRRRHLIPYFVGGLLAITALAGPTLERQPQPVFREQAGLVILLDLSRSMSAVDLAPSRLDRARFKIKDLLSARAGGQTGLVVFAAQPFTVAPLTDDSRTIDAQLAILTPDLMPAQGSDIPAALKHARGLLKQAGYLHGDMLLVTDGIEMKDLARARAALVKSGMRLSVLGVGTAAGAPVPDVGGGFISDSQGGIVISKLESNELTQLAQGTGGIFVPIATTNTDIDALLALFKRGQTMADATRTDLTANEWRDLGPWLLLPLLACAALAFRPGLALLGLLALGLSTAQPARADWWLTPDQAGQRAFNAQRYHEATKQFTDRRWRAAAQYRADKFEQTLTELEKARDPEDIYNKGNALARLGRYEDAIAAYDSVLKEIPGHEDAAHNRDIVQKIIDQLQPDDKPEKSEEEQQQAQRDKPQGGSENKPGDTGEQQGQEGGRDTEMRPPDSSEDPTQAQNERSEQETSRQANADRSADKQGSSADANKTDEQTRAEQTQNTAEGDPETALATEQWLRQIPDDPGGLLRRKFQYQYSRRSADQPPSETPW